MVTSSMHVPNIPLTSVITLHFVGGSVQVGVGVGGEHLRTENN